MCNYPSSHLPISQPIGVSGQGHWRSYWLLQTDWGMVWTPSALSQASLYRTLFPGALVEGEEALLLVPSLPFRDLTWPLWEKQWCHSSSQLWTAVHLTFGVSPVWRGKSGADLRAHQRWDCNFQPSTPSALSSAEHIVLLRKHLSRQYIERSLWFWCFFVD